MQVFPMKIPLLSGIVFFISVFLIAQASYATPLDDGWSGVLEIKINSTSIGSDLDDFPIFLNMSDLSNTSFFTDVQADGDDINITDSSNNALNFELVDIDTSAQTGQVWIRANVSSSSDTSILLYYNNPSATGPSASFQEATWTSDYEAVYHFNGDPASGGGPESVDSTSNSLDGETVNMEVGDLVSSQVGKGWSTDGVNEYVTYGSHKRVNPNFTISGWIHPRGTSNFFIFGRVTTTAGHSNYDIHSTDDGGNIKFGSRIHQSDNTVRQVDDPSSLALNEWYFVTLKTTSSEMELFINGVSVDTNSLYDGTVKADTAPNFAVATNPHLPGTGNRNLIIDEIRIAASALTDDWILAEYSNQNSPPLFYSIAANTTTPNNLKFSNPSIIPASLEYFSSPELWSSNITVQNMTDNATVGSVYLDAFGTNRTMSLVQPFSNSSGGGNIQL